MEEGSGTRSSLLWEVKRLIEECKNLPQVLVMENVPQVHGTKNMASFQAWLKFLESKGYSSFWQDMNSKNYGVAQSRNRTIVVSFLGSGTFKFPQPYPLKKRMKDYLEDEVDEKFYLNNEKAKKLIDKLIVDGKILTDRQTDRPLTLLSENQESLKPQTVSKQELMRESQTNKQMVLGYLNMNGYDKMNVDIATTLCARDYKGFGTGFNHMNGVVEWEKKE